MAKQNSNKTPKQNQASGENLNKVTDDNTQGAGEDLNKVIAEKDQKISALEAKLKAEKEQHEKTKADSQQVIGELKKQLLNTEKKVEEGSSALEVKHGSKTYEVKINSFTLGGTTYTGKDLKENPALVKQLVELGSGVLAEKNV